MKIIFQIHQSTASFQMILSLLLEHLCHYWGKAARWMMGNLISDRSSNFFPSRMRPERLWSPPSFLQIMK